MTGLFALVLHSISAEFTGHNVSRDSPLHMAENEGRKADDLLALL